MKLPNKKDKYVSYDAVSARWPSVPKNASLRFKKKRKKRK